MTLEELKSLLDEACLDSYGEGCYDIGCIDADKYGLEVVEEDDWTQDHKYQYADTIVKDGEGNHFLLSNSRSGSYHTDWYYQTPSISQVKRVEKEVTKIEVTWEGV